MPNDGVKGSGMVYAGQRFLLHLHPCLDAMKCSNFLDILNNQVI